MTLFGGVLVVGGGSLMAVSLGRWVAERRYLQAFLLRAVPAGRVRTHDDLVRLRGVIRDTISFDPASEGERRPLLRAPARRVLERGYGFCGENARVSVRLLGVGGVRAHRLYLFGRKWGHVVVVHRWEGGWRVFDAHGDPRTLPPDPHLGHVAPHELSAFTNTVEDNPWIDAAWAKPLRGCGPLARWHPPRVLAALAESPDLIRAVCGAIGLAVGLWLGGR